MESRGLHLLTLPREIRNNVYDYLSHSINLRTVETLAGLPTAVNIINAPCINILLAHSQLRDEYLESDCFTNLSANITDVKAYKDHLVWSHSEEMAALDNAALARVRNVTLRHLCLQDENMDHNEMVHDLLAKGVDLLTLRVSEERLLTIYTDKMLPTTLNFESWHSPSVHPNSISGLTLLQYITACKMKSVKVTLDAQRMHTVLEVKAYVLSSKAPTAELWTPEEASIIYPCPDWVWQQLPQSLRNLILGRSTVKMVSWKENSVVI